MNVPLSVFLISAIIGWLLIFSYNPLSPSIILSQMYQATAQTFLESHDGEAEC